MADKMFVIITARKEVANIEAARAVYDLVKTKLADHPEVQITGQASNHFDLDQS